MLFCCCFSFCKITLECCYNNNNNSYNNMYYNYIHLFMQHQLLKQRTNAFRKEIEKRNERNENLQKLKNNNITGACLCVGFVEIDQERKKKIKRELLKARERANENHCNLGSKLYVNLHRVVPCLVWQIKALPQLQDTLESDVEVWWLGTNPIISVGFLMKSLSFFGRFLTDFFFVEFEYFFVLLFFFFCCWNSIILGSVFFFCLIYDGLLVLIKIMCLFVFWRWDLVGWLDGVEFCLWLKAKLELRPPRQIMII